VTFDDIEKYGEAKWLGTGGGTQEEDVSTATGPARLDTEAGREATAVGNPNDP